MNASLLGLLAFLLVLGSLSLWFVRIQRVQIPEDRRGFVASWLSGAALGVFALMSGPGWLAGAAALVAVFAGLFFSVLYFVSAQRVADGAIRVGEPLRDFSAVDENGETFELASLAGHPVLLKFFRGHW